MDAEFQDSVFALEKRLSDKETEVKATFFYIHTEINHTHMQLLG